MYNCRHRLRRRRRTALSNSDHGWAGGRNAGDEPRAPELICGLERLRQRLNDPQQGSHVLRALVTGVGGFLGRYIARLLLKQGDSVRGFSRSIPAKLDRRIDMVRGDVRDAGALASACAGIDAVFHTAAVAGIWGPWRSFHAINTVGTHNVIAACRHQHVAKLIFTSSPSVTFDGTDQEGVDESVAYPRRWLCHYPHSKALAEQQVLAANGTGELLTCALRPHLIWGPGDRHLVPRLLARARQGRLMRIGAGGNLVDMVYVENAAWAHLQAAEALRAGSPVAGRAYFISQGEPVNCWDWVDQILALADLPPLERSISRRNAWRLGHAMEVVYRLLGLRSEPPMTRFLAAQLSTSHFFDISRARSDFGYQVRVSTASGMRRLGIWLRAGNVNKARA